MPDSFQTKIRFCRKDTEIRIEQDGPSRPMNISLCHGSIDVVRDIHIIVSLPYDPLVCLYTEHLRGQRTLV